LSGICLSGVIIQEAILHSLDFMFLLLGFANYVAFLTFNYVIDSFTAKNEERKCTSERTILFLFRLCMHGSAASLIFVAIFAPTNCSEYVYPWPFLCLIYMIVLNQGFSILLRCRNYLIDPENKMPMSKDRLRFNKDLFEAQTLKLWNINIIFGAFAIFVVVVSYNYLDSE
jgi:hypothetical protein